MRQLLFTGFNAFGQHSYKGNSDDDVDRMQNNFNEITFPFDSTSGVIAISWRYTAYAMHDIIWLQGLLKETTNKCLELKAPDKIKSLAAGENQCLVLLENGTLYKVQAKLGAVLELIKLEDPNASRPLKRSVFGAPKSQSSPSSHIISSITHIACGSHINVAISSSNAVWSIPSCLHQFSDWRQWRVKQLCCGHEHAMLLNTNGDVYVWGNGLRGQLGQTPLGSEEIPALLEALAGVKITWITAGGWHSAAISAFGDVYTWGYNCNGQLGIRVLKPGSVLKEPTVYPLPQLIDLPPCCKDDESCDESCSPEKIYAGARHTVLRRRCGRLWVSGWSAHRQLGNQETKSFLDAFQYIDAVAKDSDCDILCGPWATLLIKNH